MEKNGYGIGIDNSIIDIDIRSDGKISSSSDSPDEVKYQGKRKYIQECVLTILKLLLRNKCLRILTEPLCS